jgi:mitosis inhibitor protein kinase SWE1
VPLRQQASTPPSISAFVADPASGVVFHRLALLDAPRLLRWMPDWGVIEDDDSGCEVEEDNYVAGKKLFVNRLPLALQQSQSWMLFPKKPLLINMPQKGSAMDEVTEAISPGGHILKRWTCSQWAKTGCIIPNAGLIIPDIPVRNSDGNVVPRTCGRIL